MALQRNRRGSILLPSGETITKREQQEFRKAVSSANAFRSREIEKLSGTGQQVYRDFGKTNDVLLTKKSASFTKKVDGKSTARFQTKREFYNALERAKTTIPSVQERARIYKQNTIDALKTAYGDTPLTRKLSVKIMGMSSKQFVKKVDSGELQGVEFIYYDPENEKLKTFANSLGIDITSSMPLPTAKNRR